MSIVPALRRNLLVTANRTCAQLPAAVQASFLSALSRLPYERRRPTFLMVEPTNGCNIHCHLCPVGAGVMRRPRGFMDVDRYRDLIDEVSVTVRRIVMNFAGEPFLHPRIGEMIAIAEKRGIEVTVGTNGTIDKMEEVARARPTEILYALDGLTQESLSAYRRGADLEKVKANLRKLLAERERLGSSKPRVVLQFVVMRHNEAELEDLLALAREYGVDEVALTPVIVNDFFDTDRMDMIRRFVPKSTEFRQYRGSGEMLQDTKPILCLWALQSVILWNGDVSVCCFDYDGRHVAGNAFTNGGFFSIWENEEYRRIRAAVVRRELPLCQKCDFSTTKPTRFRIGPESPAGECSRVLSGKRGQPANRAA